MADRRTNFLVTIVFDENLHIGNQIDTEYSFKNEIIKDLQHLVKGREIKHFIVADDEVINDKLKKEPALDQIRAEIEQIADEEWKHDEKWAIGLRYAVKIIDKYKTESEADE